TGKVNKDGKIENTHWRSQYKALASKNPAAIILVSVDFKEEIKTVIKSLKTEKTMLDWQSGATDDDATGELILPTMIVDAKTGKKLLRKMGIKLNSEIEDRLRRKKGRPIHISLNNRMVFERDIRRFNAPNV